MKKLIRFLIYGVYLALTGAGLIFLVAELAQKAAWPGCAMLLAVSFAGYALSGFVKRRVALYAVLAALASVAAVLFLLPYGGWNVVLAIVSIAGVIIGARHNWSEEDTQLIDPHIMVAGLLISAGSWFVALLNLCELAQKQIGYAMYFYVVLSVLLVNRRSIQLNAGGQARRMMRSNQIMAWGFIGIFTLAVFFDPLQKAVGSTIRMVLTGILSLFDNKGDPKLAGPMADAPEGGALDLSALGDDVKDMPQWVETLSNIVIYTVTIAALLALVVGMVFILIKAIKTLNKYLKDWFASFGSAGNEDYAEESEQLMSAQSMRRQFQEDLTRRVKKLFERPVRWSALSPNERVRHVYGKMLEQEKRITERAENLTPQELCRRAEKDTAFAALYGRVRYAEDPVSADEAEKYRSYLKG